MNSNSQSANSPHTNPHRLADIVGTAIALLTLTLPMVVIANYSQARVPTGQQPITYNLKTSED